MEASFDERLFLAFYGARHGAAFLVMAAATCLGSGWSLLGLAPLLARARTRRFAWALLLTLGATAIFVFFAKLAIHRPRPAFALAHVRPLFGDPHDFSFPSGHAAGSFAFALFVATVLLRGGAPTSKARGLARSAAAIALVGLAALVAASRVYLGCHFPGDVLAGAIVGATAGILGGRRYLAARDAEGRGADFIVNSAPCLESGPKEDPGRLRPMAEPIQSNRR